MSADCPHCRRFREERDEAIEALRQARAEKHDIEESRAFEALHQAGLTAAEARLLVALLAGRSKTALHLADEIDAFNGRVITVHASRLRKRGFDIPRNRPKCEARFRLTERGRAQVLAVIDGATLDSVRDNGPRRDSARLDVAAARHGGGAP